MLTGEHAFPVQLDVAGKLAQEEQIAHSTHLLVGPVGLKSDWLVTVSGCIVPDRAPLSRPLPGSLPPNKCVYEFASTRKFV
jgi:hypothetical protein